MLPVHEPWPYERDCVEAQRSAVAEIVGHMLSEAPAGNRSRGLIAYLKAAERSLEGARLFAEGKDLACQEADEAQDHLCDPALDKSGPSEDAAGLLNEVFSSVGETDIEEDSAEQRKLTVEEYRLAHAVTSLVCLQHPEASQGLQSVRPTGVSTGHGRRCIKVAIRDRAGVVVDSSWWTEPGMDAAKVAEAVAQMIRAELDPSVPWPKVEERKLEVQETDGGGEDADQSAPQVLDESSSDFRRFLSRTDEESKVLIRKFYEEHPATEIAPAPLPDDGSWENLGLDGVLVSGEFRMGTHLDQRRTWSAALSRKSFIAKWPHGAAPMDVHALFYAHVDGAHTEQLAKDAVIEAARIAGWLAR